MHPCRCHLRTENIEGFHIFFGFASIGFCVSLSAAPSPAHVTLGIFCTFIVNKAKSQWPCKQNAWSSWGVEVAPNIPDVPGDSGLGGHLAGDRKPVPSLGQGHGCRSTGSSWHPVGQHLSSWGPSPCPVHPSPVRPALGRLRERWRLMLDPLSTRRGCGGAATSRLLKCRCSAMVDVINNAISDLFFPV